MTLDHISMFIPYEYATLFHMITRPVAVFFAYMLVEGFGYTRNKERYILRLMMSALLMYGGNVLINRFVGDIKYEVHNNIFMTLFIGGLILYLLDLGRLKNKVNKVLLYLILGILAVCGLVFTEGGTVVIPFIIITYFTKERSSIRDISYVLFSLVLFFGVDLMPILSSQTSREFWLNFGFNSSWMFVFVIPFLHIYNGEEGKKTFMSKYLFYIYYPLHLWIISIVGYLFKV